MSFGLPQFRLATELSSPLSNGPRKEESDGSLATNVDDAVSLGRCSHLDEGGLDGENARSSTILQSSVRRNNSSRGKKTLMFRQVTHYQPLMLCCLFLMIVGIQVYSIVAFQAPLLATRTTGYSATVNEASQKHRDFQLFATSDQDSNSGSKKRRKRKSKQPNESPSAVKTAAAPAAAAPAIDLKPRDDTPVQLEIKNVMRQQTPPTQAAPITSTSPMRSSSTPSAPSSTSAPVSDGLDDSLEQLLEDAKRMKEEQGGGSSGAGLLSDEEGTGIKEIIRNVLSTIVTADFFVVCGFLLWFLAGIFWRAVFNDDSVQIAFNNNFETLVQPALGVLMIAALAGNFFKEEEDPDVMM